MSIAFSLSQRMLQLLVNVCQNLPVHRPSPARLPEPVLLVALLAQQDVVRVSNARDVAVVCAC